MGRSRKRNDQQRKTQRRDTAEANRMARLKRGDRRQLERLDRAFGKGQGAKRERARLEARLAELKEEADE